MARGFRRSGSSAAPPDDPAHTRLRLFVAVEIPDRWRNQLSHWIGKLEDVAPGLCRWVRPEGFHITLAFLGNQPPEVVSSITTAMVKATQDVAPFALRPERLGYFGSPRSLEVIWAGVADEPEGALSRVRDRLADSLVNASVSFDSAPFHAHITLGRGRRGRPVSTSQAMRGAIEKAQSWTEGEATVDNLVLFQSHLGLHGSVYTLVHAVPFFDRPATSVP